MGYHVYTTKALVLSARNIGEANRFFLLFTRDLGLIHATAQGIRKEISKLRYGLQQLSLSNVSLVKGKDIFRITSVKPVESFYFSLPLEKREVSVRIFSLLRRLIQGQEPNENLFDTVLAGMEFLRKTGLDQKEVLDFERVLVFRILDNLGYIEKDLDVELLFSDEWNQAVLKKVADKRRAVVFSINRSLAESHL